MADVHKLIDGILSDPRLAHSRAFAGKVYEDEPILRTGAQMRNYLPERYREMKALAKPTYDGFDYRRPSETKLFIAQARFMEQWEDDFPYKGTFSRYYPTYAMMNDQQLRGYFSWRTKVRKGAVEETSLSFAFVYVYELLNGIGGASAQDCFNKLYRFWVAYRDFDASLNRYMKSWLRDYVIYHDLPPRLIESFIDTSFEQALIVLRNAEASACSGGLQPVSSESLFDALSALSSYRIEKSRFAKEHRAEVQNVACKTFYDLCAHCSKRRKKGLVDSWFGNSAVSEHPMFTSAVFYEPNPHEDCLYRVNEVHSYSCRNGRWVGLRNYRTASRNAELGAMLGTVDRLMREELQYGHPIKEYELPKYMLKLIQGNVAQWAEKRKEAQRRRVTIDRAQLAGIRSRAAVVREQLLVDEEREGFVPEEPCVEPEETLEPASSCELYLQEEGPNAGSVEAESASYARNDEEGPSDSSKLNEEDDALLAQPEAASYGLSPVELAYLRALMIEPSTAAASLGSEEEDLVVDSINEKLFDLLGDTALEFGADGPQIIDDYREEVKGALGL